MIALLALAAAADTPATDACALRSSYGFLRDLAFSRAAAASPTHSADLGRLRRATRAQADDVRSVSYDPASGRLECRMTLRLALPASARDYFGGRAELSAPVRYWAEPQEDGSGYSLITEGLAPVSAAILAAAARFPVAPDFGPALNAAPPPEPNRADESRRDRKAGFDCRSAATAVEDMICGNDALAEADRTLSQRYFAARATMGSTAKARLLADQRRFLARRDRCRDDACLVGLYMARAAELPGR
ncbi:MULTISPECIES: lysozyme inhibitor LprI family protein [Sphingomonas]|uniref:lysozyme inhibitor LprI family protein n=1 Tax=Sphingomonas TaxID=13687 RepID=UPI000DEF803F|nr:MULTISPECIES: lysozyme inhibitor LprI family protein [Sphingomonas]